MNKHIPTELEKEKFLCAKYKLPSGGCKKTCPCYDKDYACIGSWKRWQKYLRMKIAISFFKNKGLDTEQGNGVLYLQSKKIPNKTFVFSPSTGKWKIKGKNKWYRSRDYKDFFFRFYN